MNRDFAFVDEFVPEPYADTCFEFPVELPGARP